MVQKSLDARLARIHADPRGCKDFILADAKDADMALSIGAPGRSPESHPGEVRYRSLSEFRDIIVQIVEQKLVDIMLMAASTSEVLTIHQPHLRQQPGDAGRPRQRHDRHPHHPRQQVSVAAVAAVPHRDARSHPVRPSRLQAGGAAARGEPRPLQHHVQQRHRSGSRGAGGVQARSGSKPNARVSALSGGIRSESAGSGRGEQDAGVHQRRHRADAGRRDARKAGRCS